MNHKELLLQIYKNSFSFSKPINLSHELKDSLDIVSNNIEKQKAVFTVIITLAIHKILFPNQDIRYHQENMNNGFSGRSIDTKHITPTLKELKLTSMSESGWLTRSLEQPYPYTFEYNGKVGNKEVKYAFLFIVNHIQSYPKDSEKIVKILLNKAIQIRDSNFTEYEPIINQDKLSINLIIEILMSFINTKYHISGGSKLPVIAIHSIYEILIKELKRYENSELKKLGSHTSSDKTSQSSGDIEVFKEGVLFESVEVKFDIKIDLHLVIRAIEKIIKFNPKRYYILSTHGIKEEHKDEIQKLINDLKTKHGCQLIINGLIPSLKYYLRLIDNLSTFLTFYSKNIIEDKELKTIHKQKWLEIMKDLSL